MTVQIFIKKVIGKLRSWIDNANETLFGYAILLVQVCVCKCRYQRILTRIRKREQGKKIRVLFMSDNVSKWKCQSVYDAMLRSDYFEPLIGITMKPREMCASVEIRNKIVSERSAYFTRIGDKVIIVCDPQKGKFLDIGCFDPDIVFFEEPWLLPDSQSVYRISTCALTCYVPYSYEVAFNKKFVCMRKFHRLMWRIFANSEERVELYEQSNRNFEMAGKAVSFGYPLLDYFNNVESYEKRDLVIYAPHFSFHVDGQESILKLGTFDWNGREMLSYAKEHPEISWAFKPHPGLFDRLVDSGVMTALEASQYYAEWEKVGVGCYDGNYLQYFSKAKALITDCGSFLVEFIPTKMPIIRMIRNDTNWKPTPAHKKLFSTYYTARDWNELKTILDQVVINGQDPKCECRLSVAKELGLWGSNAGESITDFLKNMCEPRDGK